MAPNALHERTNEAGEILIFFCTPAYLSPLFPIWKLDERSTGGRILTHFNADN